MTADWRTQYPVEEDNPVPGEWELDGRGPAGVVWKHADGTTARLIPDGPSACEFEIDGETIFEKTNVSSDRSELKAKVGAALDGWPDDVEAHQRVGNTGLSSFGGSN